MKSSSSAWKKRFRPAGTWKQAEPSASTGTTPCSTAIQMWAFQRDGQVSAETVGTPVLAARLRSTSADHGLGICSITRRYLTVPGGTPSSPRYTSLRNTVAVGDVASATRVWHGRAAPGGVGRGRSGIGCQQEISGSW